MTDLISRLKLESGEFDSKIKRAGQELMAYSEHCRKMGLEMGYANRDAKDFAKDLGDMQTTSTTARGKISELSDAFVNLRVMYKNMTDEEKNNQFGKNLAASLDNLKTRIQEAKRDLADVTSELNGKSSAGGGLFSGMGSKIEGALAVFGGNLMTKAAGAVASLGSEMADMVKQGVELAKQGEGIRIAFERLGRGDILQGLRESTHGTVTDLELMKAAVKFNDFKLPVEELGTMLAFAQQKAKDTGQSVDYMVDSIVTGLGRKSLMILDNLGLSATEVKDKMKETGDMTKAVGAIIREQMAKAGDYVETAADRAAQANVSLQNKMEELGRKFGPVEEASNQLWTSMKIGILDIIGGPLATLLNQLTEAGRLKNMLNNLNGESGSGNTKVDQQLKKLNVIKKAGGSDNYFNTTLSGMVEDYNRQIMALDTQIKNGGKRPGAGSGESQDVRYLQRKMDALKIMRDQLAAGAKEINKPIKIESNIPDVTGGGRGKGGSTTTHKTIPEYIPLEGSIDAQTKKVQDLQKAWRAAADDKSREDIKKQIEQAQLVFDAMNGKTKTSKITITADTKEALEAVKKIDGVKINSKSFTVTAVDDKAADELRKMGAVQIADKTFSVIPDIGDTLEKVKAIDGVKINSKSFTVTAEDEKAADELRKMGAVRIDDKTFSVIPDIGDTLEKVKAIDGVKIDPKSFVITAETTEALAKIQEINGIKIQPKKLEVQVPKMADIAPNGLTGKARTPEILQQSAVKMKQAVKLEIDQEASKVDTETLKTLMKDAIQNGIDGMDFQFGVLGEKIGKGIDIPDSSWQGIIDQYNALREQIGEEPIVINLQTGKMDDVIKDVAKLKKTISTTAQVVGTIGQAFNAIEDPAAKVAGVVAQAIANVALAYSDALAKTQAEKFNIWGFIAASAAAMVSMGTTIASIHSATGYAEGGIVKGNHYSGDMLDGGSFGINAGELVLNRSQQGSLASQLEGGGLRNLRLSAEVQGEKIVLVANRYFRRTGQGEIVTWK